MERTQDRDSVGTSASSARDRSWATLRSAPRSRVADEEDPVSQLLALDARPTTTDRWTICSDGSSVAFHGRASRFLPLLQARFTQVTGCVQEHAVDVDVNVRSMTTGNAAYDQLLRAADPFDVARHPVARYRSTAVRWTGDTAVVDGELSLRGSTAPVRLTASRVHLADGRARLSAVGRVDRRVFGLRLELPGCAAFVPDLLDVAIDVTAVRDATG